MPKEIQRQALKEALVPSSEESDDCMNTESGSSRQSRAPGGSVSKDQTDSTIQRCCPGTDRDTLVPSSEESDDSMNTESGSSRKSCAPEGSVSKERLDKEESSSDKHQQPDRTNSRDTSLSATSETDTEGPGDKREKKDESDENVEVNAGNTEAVDKFVTQELVGKDREGDVSNGDRTVPSTDILDDTVVGETYARDMDSNEEDDDNTVFLCSPRASPLRQQSCDLVVDMPVIRRESTDWSAHVSDSVMGDECEEEDKGGRKDEPPVDADNDDSDSEIGDKDEFTARRTHGRERRYAERDEDRSSIPLHEKPGNQEVKEGFAEYLKETSASASTTGSVPSTVPKYIGHLFTYVDSWLQHQTEHDPTFKASMLFNFGQPDFRLISSPVSWVNHSGTCKETAGRRLERLKAHAAFRRYLCFCISRDKNKFGNNLAGIMMRGEIERDVLSIDTTVNSSGIWDLTHKMSEQHRQKKIEAVNIANPEEESNLRASIGTWNASECRERKMRDMNSAWERCTQMVIRPTNRVLNQLGMFVKFEVHNLNRDRASAYDFSNSDYQSKRAKYVPKTTEAEDDDNFTRVFHPVPVGMNTNAPPKDDPSKKPSAWVLTVMGDTAGIKKQEATVTVFTPKIKELCDKYRDLKELFFMVGVSIYVGMIWVTRPFLRASRKCSAVTGHFS